MNVDERLVLRPLKYHSNHSIAEGLVSLGEIQCAKLEEKFFEKLMKYSLMDYFWSPDKSEDMKLQYVPPCKAPC